MSGGRLGPRGKAREGGNTGDQRLRRGLIASAPPAFLGWERPVKQGLLGNGGLEREEGRWSWSKRGRDGRWRKGWSQGSSESEDLASSSWRTLTIRDLNEKRPVSLGTHTLAAGLFVWHLVVLFPCFLGLIY